MLEAFPPVAAPDARVLVLGSMPGVASLEAGQYYAWPHNAFWPIMGELFDAGPERAYANRLQLLMLRGVALWDVVAQCRRVGSLDAAIDPNSVNVNDFAAFYADHPDITHVFFNGRKAADLYRRHVQPSLAAEPSVHALPSTSPAHAAMPLAEKLVRWSAVAEALV